MGSRLHCVFAISVVSLGTACGVSDPVEDTAAVTAGLVNEPVTMSGPVHTTGISGEGGWFFVLGDPFDEDLALWGLSSKEHTNEPCWVQALTEDLNFAPAKGLGAKDLCGSGAPNDASLLTADFADSDLTGDRAFVSGVKVCMNSDRTRVKGWILFGRSITASGQLVELSGTALGGPRPNCDAWQSPVFCPAGQLATAAEVHFDAPGEPRSWRGIALRCRAVTVVP
jgi:hypothetical protein